MLALAGLLGCSSAGPSAEPSATPSPPATQPAAAAPAATPAPAATATFSAEQATRGKTVFDATCSACHSIGDFRGNAFIYSWRRRTAWNLYQQVVQTMPEDAPGSLPDQEYVDVIAYLLQLNGHRAGDGELSATQASLGQIPVDRSEIGSGGS